MKIKFEDSELLFSLVLKKFPEIRDYPNYEADLKYSIDDRCKRKEYMKEIFEIYKRFDLYK